MEQEFDENWTRRQELDKKTRIEQEDKKWARIGQRLEMDKNWTEIRKKKWTKRQKLYSNWTNIGQEDKNWTRILHELDINWT